MAATKAKKLELIKKFGSNEKDSGSIEVQIAILTEDIKLLTKHFKIAKKDNHSRRGLIAKVNQRKKFLAYLAKNDNERYQTIIKELKLRK